MIAEQKSSQRSPAPRPGKSRPSAGRRKKQTGKIFPPRGQPEASRRTDRQLIDDVLAAIQDGISILEPDLTIRHVNPVMKEWHRSNLPLAGRKCFQAYHNRESPCSPCPTLRCLESGQTERDVIPGRPGSPAKWLELFSYPIKDLVNGEITGVVEFVCDITEQKKAEADRRGLERQVQQAQKLESLGVLAGGIAHDFNNILMVVLGNAELALEAVPTYSPARRNLEEIIAAIRQAADLCRQMFAYAGKSSSTRRLVDLQDLVEEIAHLLQTTISKKAVLNYHLAEGLPPIEADPSQVRQVVMNLLINASEALAGKSGFITVSTGAVLCGKEELRRTEFSDDLEPGFYVFLDVADTGTGMDEQTRRRIFEPFFSTKFTGRGLGLAAVLGIVRGHRGAIGIETEPGKGTTFRVLFPALETSPVGQSGSGEGASFGDSGWQGDGTVLLAEDEETLRAMGVQVLRRLGLQVLTAADGQGAVELFRRHRREIDLVLLDLTMPRLDGREAFDEIRKLEPDARVVITSGYSEAELAERFSDRKVAGILQKPYSLVQIEKLLSRLLRRKGSDQ